MPSGIRATVEFDAEGRCPLVDLSRTAETTIEGVTPSVAPPGRRTDAVALEFAVDGETAPAAVARHLPEARPVFSHGPTTRYRSPRPAAEDCPCVCLGEFGVPVARYVARRGTLTLVFHAADYEQLRTVVAALDERFPDLEIRRFVRSAPPEARTDGVFVDRGKLTARQLEALETAHEMGYFDRPRGANATEVAAELGIDPSTLGQHLAAAQRKLLADLL